MNRCSLRLRTFPIMSFPVLLNFSIFLPVTHTCFLLQRSLAFVLSLNVEETICCCVVRKTFFFFYVLVFCLIMVSEHKVKHKSISCKSPELGFSFDQAQWANPNQWKQQHSWLQACVSYIWHVDRIGMIVLSFSPLPKSVTALTTSSVLLSVFILLSYCLCLG